MSRSKEMSPSTPPPPISCDLHICKVGSSKGLGEDKITRNMTERLYRQRYRWTDWYKINIPYFSNEKGGVKTAQNRTYTSMGIEYE